MGPDLLQQLRDIHYPQPISMWPLAVGWYVVIAILFCLLIAACYFCYRYYRRNRLKNIVLQRLAELQQEQVYKHNIPEELSKLLRRAALARYPRQEVAGLYGEEWLLFLDKTSMSDGFSQGPGRLLLVSPYCKAAEELPEQLFHVIHNWVKKNL